MDENPAHFQALALSGGGFRGLYTAQLLADFEQHLDARAATRFELIAGTSIGGILALALACEIPAANIVSLFRDHGAEIFRRRSWSGYFKSKYSSTPLQSLLADSSLFGERQLGDCRHPVLVPAINFTTGKPVLFKTAHHPSFQVHKHFRLVDVAMATSAAPTFFPRHVINDCQYVDGGLFANAPGLLALHEAEFFFGQSPGHVHVLSVGTMSTKATVDPRKNRNGGMTSWGGINPVDTPGQLFGLTLSAQESLVDFVLKHRLGERYTQLDDDLTDARARAVSLDKATPAATEVLTGTAHERAKWAIGDDRIRALLSHRANPPTFY